ncbi:unnamed protein product [Nippostrongylus brasiliensis]|uniref:C-type lectin domain-containing protein n=1 Tax=Nippostrongylus brasiliensis TaxID=27835 RepID=A0A0N4YEI6_NIPBR|nr:unnamed protein product [Nippostrongylus brasiliensis]
MFVSEPLAFGLAEDDCISNKGHLVSVMNGFENAMLGESAVAQNIKSPYFVGMNRLQGNWSNVDGSSSTFTNWSPGQPTASATCAVASAPDGVWTSVACSNPHPYRFFWANFENAEELCVSHGGHLTSIHSLAENTFVNEIAESGNDYGDGYDLTWIGLTQANYPASSTWTWTDGTPFDYKDWGPNQPDNYKGQEHCGQLHSDYMGKDPSKDSSYRHWNDIACSTNMRAYVCKKAALH